MNKKDLIDGFNKMTPEHAQKQKMLNVILESRKAEKIPMKRKGKSLALVAAVVAVCIIATTTALAVNFGWHEKLIEFLDPSNEQMEMLSGNVTAPDATISKNGVTVAVKQTLSDSYGIYVLYEMTVPDNIDLSEVDWRYAYLTIPYAQTDEATGLGIIGSELLEQSGNTRTVLMFHQMSKPFENGTIRLHFEDLEHIVFDEETETFDITTVWEGELELEWDFNYENVGKTLKLDTPLSINGSKNTITKIVLSPISICVFVQGDDAVMRAAPVVRFKDGSEINYTAQDRNSSFSHYLIDEANMIYNNQLYFRFANIISPDDVKSITIGDVTIPVQ